MKNSLRKDLLCLRQNVQSKQEKNLIILNKLVDSELYQSAIGIMTYVSTPDEVDTHSLITYMLRDQKRIFVPKIMPGRTLAIFEISSFDELFPGKCGILEPMPLHQVHYDDIELVLAPGIAYSRDGYRLGYGGGYYDRLLPHISCPVIGLCYSDCLLDSLPTQAHDVPVSFILTEKELLDVCPRRM